MNKRVGILFGGKSAEHEVSILSMKSVVKNLDDVYDTTLFYITKEGDFLIYEREEDLKKKPEEKLSKKVLDKLYQIDIMLILLHGPNGEDGSIQGFLEVLNIPYVGSKVLGSSVCMDKIIAKKILNNAGIKTADYFELYDRNYEELLKWAEYPLFVKPSNMGSSIGITKAHNEEELLEAIDEAFLYDSRILIEKAIDGIELEVAVLETDTIYISRTGRALYDHEFYDYVAKYTGEGSSKMKIPSGINTEIENKIKDTVYKAYKELSCKDLVRVDFFLTKENEIYVNELNTLPGMTTFSMYPSLLEDMGIKYNELLNKLLMGGKNDNC